MRLLVTAHSRVRIGSCGVIDVLEAESKKSLADLQQEDLLALGRLIIMLACRSEAALQNAAKSVEFMKANYSPDMVNLALLLVRKPATIFDIGTALAGHLMVEMDALYGHSDALDHQLANECNNGRIARLLLKLGCINERPELKMDRQWAETGDRYVLKLFRDYVFHQIDESGSPIVDFGHIIESLNKLDASDQEKILLMSRDNQRFVCEVHILVYILTTALLTCNIIGSPTSLQYFIGFI